MHGFTTIDRPEAEPATADGTERRWHARLRDALARHRGVLLVVLLPTLLTVLYFGVLVSRQYASEAHFVLRTAGTTTTPSGGIGELLGLTPGVTPAQAESQALADYLTSHDAVAVLEAETQLRQRFRYPDIDWLSRLSRDATPETVLTYYRRQVSVHYSPESGITTLIVRAFRPADARNLARALLAIGESRVNLLNKRAYDDAVAVTRRQLADAERELGDIQTRMTGYRLARRDIDPERSSTAQIALVSQLQTSLATARAELAATRRALAPRAPQLEAMQRRVDALAAQVSAESARLTGGNQAMAGDLGGYEELRLRQEFAAKRYAAAAAAMQSAREQAIRQQLFVLRVVEPNLPVKSTYPRSLRVIASVFLCLSLLYGIGWLIAAGVREHAA